MEVIKDFKFSVNVSIDTYKDKVEAQDCISSRELAKKHNKSKMSFIEKTLTTSEFLKAATSGHSFANLFNLDKNRKYPYTWRGFTTWTYAYYQKGHNKGGLKLNFKTNEYYKGQQVIFVDIDYTEFDSIYDYIDCLTYTPTIMYTSFSDLKMKGGVVSRRFRLVYVFDKVLNPDEVITASYTLYNSIVNDTNEPIEDECGLRGAQYMNGTNGGETFCSNVIYSIDDFKIEREEINQEVEVKEENEVQEKSEEVSIDKYLLRDMERLEYKEFMHYYSRKYPYFYRTERPEDWNEEGWQLTDENYLALYYNVDPVIDGEKRRKTLFERMCLRRVINPEATPEVILFNAYVDLNRYFNNDDDVITINCLKANVLNAFKLSIEDIKKRYNAPIKYSSIHRPKFIVRNVAGETKKQTIAKTRKKLKDEEIGEIYDSSLTIKENLDIFESMGIKIGKSRIYKWVKENGLELKKDTSKKDSIIDYIDKSKSIRENIKILEEKGISVSYRQVRNALNTTQN